MSLSIRNRKFLLDENVHLSLFKYLKEKGIDVARVPKSASDLQVAAISKREKRIIVTNDEDFTQYTKTDVFAVIWLRIAQNNLQAMLTSLGKLLDSTENLSGKLIILKSSTWEVFDLGSWE